MVHQNSVVVSFLEKCRLIHTSETFEIKTCNLRDPKVCQFYMDYRRCKFREWCYLLHRKNVDIERKIIEFDEKIALVEKQEMDSIKNLKMFSRQKLRPLKTL